jgi:hypothetical protein
MQISYLMGLRLLRISDQPLTSHRDHHNLHRPIGHHRTLHRSLGTGKTLLGLNAQDALLLYTFACKAPFELA